VGGSAYEERKNQSSMRNQRGNKARKPGIKSHSPHKRPDNEKKRLHEKKEVRGAVSDHTAEDAKSVSGDRRKKKEKPPRGQTERSGCKD